MDGLLLEESRNGTDSGELLEVIRDLRRELAQLRIELRQQVGYWKSRHADALKRIAVVEQDNEQLRGDNSRLRDQLFGRKSEKQSSKKRSNYLEGFDDEDPAEASSAAESKPQKKQKGPKRRDFNHLP